MLKKAENICIFLTGGVIYGLIEIAWRGYTHWSMTLAGGICFFVIHLLDQRLSGVHILVRCAASCLLITSVEYVAGVTVNICLGLNVWDYSSVYGNLYGQICPAFSCLWFLISYPAFLLSGLIDRFFGMLEQDGIKQAV